MPRSLILIAPLGLLAAVGFSLHHTSEETPSPHPRPFSVPLAACFAPGTPQDLVDDYGNPKSTKDLSPYSLLYPELSKALQLSSRWSTTATDGSGQGTQGNPVTVTWSIVADGTSAPGDGTISFAPSDLRARLAEIYGGSSSGPAEEQPWFPIFADAFANISTVSGLTLVYEPNDDGATVTNANAGSLGVRGDIRITGRPIDGDSSTLAFNYYPNYGDMVIDTDDSYFENTSNNSIRLRNVIEHEVGHGLGLNHVCPIDETKLMEPFVTTDFIGVQFDEIYSLQRQYGDIYERTSSEKNNDTFANATPLSIPIDNSLWEPPQWLSIDDNNDVDYYAIPLNAAGRISVTVTPSPNSYLEGSQSANGECEAGTLFDAASRQDLVIGIYDPSYNLIEEVDANGIGLSETLSANLTAGTNYLKISADTTNNTAQLYKLSINLDGEGPLLELVSGNLSQELFSQQNGLVDPLETVVYDFVVQNVGDLAANDVQLSLGEDPALIPLDTTRSLGDLEPGESSSFSLTFALDESCGSEVALQLLGTAINANPVSFSLEVQLGEPFNNLREGFEDSVDLPAGWLSTVEEDGLGWLMVDTEGDGVIDAIRAEDSDVSGSSVLTSPVFVARTSESQLVFTHNYDVERGRDGGVLELSIDGGDWADWRTSGGTFDENGYNSAVRGVENPIGTRAGWTGDSGGSVTTVATLPEAAIGKSCQLRWVLGNDLRNANEGWTIEEINFTGEGCDETGPVVTLSPLDTEASEFPFDDSASLLLSTVLPVAVDTTVDLTLSGSADPLLDYSGLSDIFIPAFSSSATLDIQALPDTLVEGEEALTVTLAGSESIEITINDSPYAIWAASQLGELPADPLDDPDADSFVNLIEYANGTDPVSADSVPAPLELTWLGESLRLAFPVAALPADVVVQPESSSNLDDWHDHEAIQEDSFFEFTNDDAHRFFRLRYELAQP
ncbi:MAG: matrixin family metalloprotease [Verrucomicrobiota bacterium JB023]|nr:matrixin family metalloprotease [Verrucomicrobiota bacterium JB023]